MGPPSILTTLRLYMLVELLEVLHLSGCGLRHCQFRLTYGFFQTTLAFQVLLLFVREGIVDDKSRLVYV